MGLPKGGEGLPWQAYGPAWCRAGWVAKAVADQSLEAEACRRAREQFYRNNAVQDEVGHALFRRQFRQAAIGELFGQHLSPPLPLGAHLIRLLDHAYGLWTPVDCV
jgi:hypothetical protein